MTTPPKLEEVQIEGFSNEEIGVLLNRLMEEKRDVIILTEPLSGSFRDRRLIMVPGRIMYTLGKGGKITSMAVGDYSIAGPYPVTCDLSRIKRIYALK